jgi:hypothetical protein
VSLDYNKALADVLRALPPEKQFKMDRESRIASNADPILWFVPETLYPRDVISEICIYSSNFFVPFSPIHSPIGDIVGANIEPIFARNS